MAQLFKLSKKLLGFDCVFFTGIAFTIPPFLIITYELLILFGILFTVLGFFISSRLPAITKRPYVMESAVDKFAVSVACTDDEGFRRAEVILRDAGAEEVREMLEVGE